MQNVLTVFIFIFIITMFIVGFYLVKRYVKQCGKFKLKIKELESRERSILKTLFWIAIACFLMTVIFIGIYLGIYI